MPDTIIVSDLDGTLLDSADFSFAAAQPALSAIRARGIPLVLCSSKTRAEIEVYRQRLNNRHPFVAENGGGIFIPRGYFSATGDSEPCDGYRLIRLGKPAAEIRGLLLTLREQLGIKVRGFSDMSSDEVARLTGLSREEAVLAKQRDFDEAFVFEGEPDERFLRAIEAAGLHWTRGRFFHVMGDHNKGLAVKLLKSLYQRGNTTVTTIGLGDSLNDLTLLAAVDYPVLVRHADGTYEASIDLPGLLKTEHPGPAGWNDAVLQLLSAIAPQASGRDTARQTLLEIYNAALAAVDPYRAVLNAVELKNGCLLVSGKEYDLAAYERVIVTGAGKATARMALAIEELLGTRIFAGIVIVKEGHKASLRHVEQIEASHPVPGEAGAAGTQRVLQLLHAADERTLVICLLSGGASALLVAPAGGVTLQDKQRVTELLLNAGASIAELNAVRKHLSAVKGGRLAQAAWPAHLLTLLLSDVIGDRLDVIASGPTAADESSFAAAWAVLAKYGLQDRIPPRAREHLQRGMAGLEGETVKTGDRYLDRTHNVIVGGIGLALAAAAEEARRQGWATQMLSAELQGEARNAAEFLARRARDTLAEMGAAERRCLLCGGETTVTVQGTGKGGRNQELALAFALEIDGLAGVTLLSAGTDGTDGPTEAAGAFVDGETASLAHRLNIDAAGYLANNDSYSFFRQLDAASHGDSQLVTGPTGTNVMDIQIVLCEQDVRAVAPDSGDMQ